MLTVFFAYLILIPIVILSASSDLFHARVQAQTTTTPQNFSKVVSVGDASPVGGTFSNLGGIPPLLLDFNDNGQVLFWADVSGGTATTGLFLYSDGRILKVVANGDPTPIGGTFINVAPFVEVGKLNNRGEVAFIAEVRVGDNDSNKDGIFLFSGGGIRKVVVVGDQAPEPSLVEPKTEPDIFTGVGGLGFDLNDNGEISINALQGKPTADAFVSVAGIYLHSGGATHQIITDGFDTGNGKIGLFGASVAILNNNRQVAFWSPIDGKQGIFLCEEGLCQKVVVTGDPIPGGTWPTHLGPCCITDFNDRGEIAVQPGIIPGGEILLSSGLAFKKIVASGDAVPQSIGGGTFRGVVIRDIPHVALNNRGDIVFRGIVEGGAIQNGLFLASKGAISKVVSAGDPTPLGGTFSEFSTAAVNNANCIAFESSKFLSDSSIWVSCHPNAIPIQSVLNEQPSIASEPGSFALVAEKDMVVRVFFNTGANGPTADAEALMCVDSSVEECLQIDLFRTEGTVFPLAHEFSIDERRQAKNSLNFFINGEDAERLLTAGDHTFNVKLNPMVAGTFLGAEVSFKGIFRASETLNLFVFPIIFEDENGNRIGPEDSPAAGLDDKDKILLQEAADYIKAAYPMDENNLGLRVLSPLALGKISQLTDAKFGIQEFNKVKRAFVIGLLLDTSLSALFRTSDPENNLVLAVVNNVIGTNNAPLGRALDGVSLLGFTYLPEAQGLPFTAVTVDRIPEGDPTLQSPNNIVIQSTSAHEVGHIFGFGDEYANPSARRALNPPHSELLDNKGTAAGYYILEDELAFDVGAIRPKFEARNAGQGPPANPQPGAVFVAVDTTTNLPDPDVDPIANGPIYGYMGGTGRSGVPAGLGAALEGAQDVRSWTRQLNYQHLYNQLTHNPHLPSHQSEPPRNVAYISGFLTEDGRGDFDSIFVASSDLNFTEPAGDQYSIQLRDSEQVILDQIEFNAPFERHLNFDGDESVNEIPFNFVVDLPSTTGSISLFKAGSLLSTFTRSANAPTISLIAADLADSLIKVHWESLDPDGDTLKHMVLYSPDGTDRFLLAHDVTETTLESSLEDLPLPETGAQVIVQSHDGFNFAEDSLLLSLPPTAKLTAEKDGFIRASAKDTNAGANEVLILQKTGDKKSLVSFDLASFETQQVSDAKLKLFVTHNGGNWGDGRTISAHKLLSDWTEGNGIDSVPIAIDPSAVKQGGTGEGVTWACATDINIANTQPDCDLKWNGGSFESTASDLVLITSTTEGVWIEFDVTSDVNSFLNGDPTDNFGWLIKKTKENDIGRIAFASKESIELDQRPELVLTFG